MTDDSSYGEGIRFLAAVSGESPQAIASDRAALGRGLAAFGREALSLVRDSASGDPEVREAAQRRWEELRALLPEEEATVEDEPRQEAGMSAEGRERLRGVLSRIVDSLEDLERRTRR